MSTERFERAIQALDGANSDDPARETYEGEELPREVAYARRMTAWLGRLDPTAPEELRLAVRAQHLRRFALPRSRYPDGRSGYLRWRTDCAEMHASEAGRILHDVGYETPTIERIQALIKKHGRREDPDAQSVEDTACLVFLEGYLAGFSRKHDEAKLVDILQKTWRKMSPRARELALQIDLPPETRALVEKALA